MIKLTNLSERTVDITKSISIPPKQYISGDIEITPRIYQLITMGILQQTNISKNTSSAANSHTFISNGAKRRQQVLNSVMSGDIKDGVNLAIVKNEAIKKRKK